MMIKIILLLSLVMLCPTLFAQEIKLPIPSGPYQISTKSIEIEDPSRKEKNSCWGNRKFMVQAYYPSPANSASKNETYPYMPETLKGGSFFGSIFRSYAQPNGEIATNGPFPLILMHPGLGGVRQNQTILCEELASQGYVVLSLDHPYVSCFVKFKDGSIITPKLITSWRVNTDRDYRYEWFEQAVVTAIENIEFLLNRLPELNQTIFQNQLDLKRIGIMGHSFGGNVALRAGFKLARIKTIIDIDSKLTEKIILPENTNKKPVLFIRSNQYQEDVGERLQIIPNGKVVNFVVEHSAFNDMAYLVAKAPALLQLSYFNQLWGLCLGTGLLIDPDTKIGAYQMDEWLDTLKRTIREFWDEELKK